MPHHRARYIEPLIAHSLKHSPIVGILGQRQSGKTTLVHSLAKEYETLDRRNVLESAQGNPDLFIANRASPFGIDECQLAPALFPALKEAVRVLPKKGQFILTGSVRFTSRKAIRESLTGRIFNLELLPFSLSESHSLPLPKVLIDLQILTASRILSIVSKNPAEIPEKEFDRYLESGGLPGICFQREASVRLTYFESQLETLLDRDLRLVQATTVPFANLKGLLTLMAQNQGQPTDYAELARSSQISVITLKRLVSSFEAIFLIRRLLSAGGTKAPVFFLEDQGLASYLLKSEPTSISPLYNVLRGLYGNILPQFHYRPELQALAYQYRTRGGAVVPLAFKTIHGHLGIIPSLTDEPSPAALGSARSFLEKQARSKVAIISRNGKPRAWSDRLISLPLSAVLA
jgi:predicted AAA+ superfamily ATPase